jgi:hypothetical protein
MNSNISVAARISDGIRLGFPDFAASNRGVENRSIIKF